MNKAKAAMFLLLALPMESTLISVCHNLPNLTSSYFTFQAAPRFLGSRLQHTLDALSEEIEKGPTDLQDATLIAALDSALAKPVKLRTTRGQRILCFIPLPPCSSAIIWPLGALGIGALGAGALGAGALGAGALGAGWRFNRHFGRP